MRGAALILADGDGSIMTGAIATRRRAGAMGR
jgi:hypothetical protein